MKKAGIFVVILLLLLVVWHSGWLNDERVATIVEKGIRTGLDLLERAFAFVIDKIK